MQSLTIDIPNYKQYYAIYDGLKLEVNASLFDLINKDKYVHLKLYSSLATPEIYDKETDSEELKCPHCKEIIKVDTRTRLSVTKKLKK